MILPIKNEGISIVTLGFSEQLYCDFYSAAAEKANAVCFGGGLIPDGSQHGAVNVPPELDYVGIHEVASCVGGIIGAFGIAVTQRVLDDGESRDGLAVALELRLALVVGGFDGSLDLLDGDGITLGDDEADGELGSAAVDGLGFPDICVRPASILAGDDLHGVVDFGVVIRHNRLLL